MRFIVKDNNGQTHTSKDYIWNESNGIPCEEIILEDMEKCDCILTESNASCEGDCIRFDDGEVTDILAGVRCRRCKESKLIEVGECDDPEFGYYCENCGATFNIIDDSGT